MHLISFAKSSGKWSSENYRFHKKWAGMLKYVKLNCITIGESEETENIFFHNVIVVGV